MAKLDKNQILHSLFGLFGSLLVGFLLFRADVFDYQSSSFQFVIYGLFGAVFYVYGTSLKNQLILFAVFILVVGVHW